MNKKPTTKAEKEKVGFIFIKEMNRVSPLVVDGDRVLFMVTSGDGPHHEAFVHLVIKALSGGGGDRQAIRDWYWKSIAFPVPGVYASIFLPHKHLESPIDFLKRATGFEIEEFDSDRQLENVHD